MRPLVAVAMGGYSSEFGISLLSGSHVLDALDASRFEGLRLELRPDEGWKAFDRAGDSLHLIEDRWTIRLADGT